MRAPVTFWALGALLVAYVALCTAQRDRIWNADAWEHHRAIVAMVERWNPGNPTLDSDLPSIRYSPYTAGLALTARVTGAAPYVVLSWAAVANTALLVLALWCLLRCLGELPSATAVLVVMVALWGGPPGYANSYALADLPWHQVNPSAFSFALVLLALADFLGARKLSDLRAFALVTLALLSHPMTGAFGVFALLLFALTSRAELRRHQLRRWLALTTGVCVVCVAWPCFDFVSALATTRDKLYWFNQGIVRLMLTVWCAPAILCGLLTLMLRPRESLRRCLLCAVATFGLTLASLPFHSASLARFPMPGMVFLHIAIGVLVHETGLFQPRTWPARVRLIARGEPQVPQALLEIVTAAAILYFGLPQVLAIPSEWHLAKPYLAQWLGKSDREHPHLLPKLDRLLGGVVGSRDVVLADEETAWPIPSSHGKIVAPLHYEAFVDGQDTRARDVAAFFGAANLAERKQILARYHVRYIVLNRGRTASDVWTALYSEPAVVRRDDSLVLMNADSWRAQTEQPGGHIALGEFVRSE
jgi:hypothetical protein